MTLAELLLPEFDQEAAATRRVLERLPEDRLDWRPHPRSWTVAELATHVANIPFWATAIFSGDAHDLPADAARMEAVRKAAEALERFDRQAEAARGALAGMDDARLLAPWTLSKGGGLVFTRPRYHVYRGMVVNHLAHHRGQLTIYLRLLDIPLPAIYGPSGDEGPQARREP